MTDKEKFKIAKKSILNSLQELVKIVEKSETITPLSAVMKQFQPLDKTNIGCYITFSFILELKESDDNKNSIKFDC